VVIPFLLLPFVLVVELEKEASYPFVEPFEPSELGWDQRKVKNQVGNP